MRSSARCGKDGTDDAGALHATTAGGLPRPRAAASGWRTRRWRCGAQAAFGPSANALNRKFLEPGRGEPATRTGLTQIVRPGDHGVDGLADSRLDPAGDPERGSCTGSTRAISRRSSASSPRSSARSPGSSGSWAQTTWWELRNGTSWTGRRSVRAGEAAALNAQLVGCCALPRGSRAPARIGPRRAKVTMRLPNASPLHSPRDHWDANRRRVRGLRRPRDGARRTRRVSQHANAALIIWDVAPRERWAAWPATSAIPARSSSRPHRRSRRPASSFDPGHDVVLANTILQPLRLPRAREGRPPRRVLADGRGALPATCSRAGRRRSGRASRRPASLCHGFSATPSSMLSRKCRHPPRSSTGFASLRLLAAAGGPRVRRGVFPTVAGDVSVDWTRSGDRSRSRSTSGGSPSPARRSTGLPLRTAARREPARASTASSCVQNAARVRALVCAALVTVTWPSSTGARLPVPCTTTTSSYVSENPRVQAGLTAEGRAGRSRASASNWHHATWLSHMADVELFGKSAADRTSRNALLHALNACMCYFGLAGSRDRCGAARWARRSSRFTNSAWSPSPGSRSARTALRVLRAVADSLDALRW